MRFKPLVCLATLLLAFCLSHPTRAAAQVAHADTLAPGVVLTAAQSAAVDSLMRAAAMESQSLRLAGASVDEQRALHERTRLAVRDLLTPAQRETYDAWYAAALERFESGRAQASSHDSGDDGGGSP